jgi:hypothetical protein
MSTSPQAGLGTPRSLQVFLLLLFVTTPIVVAVYSELEMRRALRRIVFFWVKKKIEPSVGSFGHKNKGKPIGGEFPNNGMN